MLFSGVCLLIVSISGVCDPSIVAFELEYISEWFLRCNANGFVFPALLPFVFAILNGVISLYLKNIVVMSSTERTTMLMNTIQPTLAFTVVLNLISIVGLCMVVVFDHRGRSDFKYVHFVGVALFLVPVVIVFETYRKLSSLLRHLLSGYDAGSWNYLNRTDSVLEVVYCCCLAVFGIMTALELWIASKVAEYVLIILLFFLYVALDLTIYGIFSLLYLTRTNLIQFV